MSGFGEESSNTNFTKMPPLVGENKSDSRNSNSGMSLFAKISSAKIGASALPKRSFSGAF
jgi:hypothetical protein